MSFRTTEILVIYQVLLCKVVNYNSFFSVQQTGMLQVSKLTSFSFYQNYKRRKQGPLSQLILLSSCSAKKQHQQQ